MQFTVHQTINIRMLRIGSISNASVFQIGSAGSIQSAANLYNTGGYESLAQPAEFQGEIGETPLVPLSAFS
ncbi:putative spore germination protein GerPB [Paraliobacillus ryukyuensis]|uniref:Spore germination protein PB n=1 Tax=Paraliobacillus ryukyuensis TaxID=200904 RepID=A0A366E7D6_9BACI|nr:spore germination protein GerPB [Paraliobacillus ryukyuensis]RBO98222.1 spore germination protein PB [Paraliobacillus ryukyuensis]